MTLNQFSLRIIGGHEVAGGYVEMSSGEQYTLQLRNFRNVPCQADVKVDGKEAGCFIIPAKGSMSLERPEHDQGRFTAYLQGTETEEFKKAGLEGVSEGELGLIQVTFTPQVFQPSHATVITLPPENRRYYPYPWYPYDPPYNPPWIPRGPYKYEIHWSDTDSAGSADSYSSTGGTTVEEGNTVLGFESSSVSSSADSVGTTTQNCASGGPMGTGLSGHSNQEFVPATIGELDVSQRTTISLRLVGKREDAMGPRPLTSIGNPVPPPTR